MGRVKPNRFHSPIKQIGCIAVLGGQEANFVGGDAKVAGKAPRLLCSQAVYFVD